MSQRLFLAVLLAGLTGVSSAGAQQRFPLSLEATIGPADGRTSGDYNSGTGSGLALDATLALRLGSVWGGRVVIGASASQQSSTNSTIFLCVPRPDGNCRQNFPVFTMFTGLAGWESGNAALRILSGPAYVRQVSVTAAGWQSRLDIALVVAGPVAVVVSGRVILIPSFNGDSFQLLAGGLGLRLGH